MISPRLRPPEAALPVTARGGEDTACSTELVPVKGSRWQSGGMEPEGLIPAPAPHLGIPRPCRARAGEPRLRTPRFSPGSRSAPVPAAELVSRRLCPCNSPPVPVLQTARSPRHTRPQRNLRILVGVAQTWGRSSGPGTCTLRGPCGLRVTGGAIPLPVRAARAGSPAFPRTPETALLDRSHASPDRAFAGFQY